MTHSSTRLAYSVLEELAHIGVQEICVCPSSRNAPLVSALAANPNAFQVYHHYEERSASFFALGRIRKTGRPVAVSVTSGTAVGELLPAVMEAHYSGLPLVLLTADRPRSYRGTGAPQTAEQVGIFGVYVSETIDLEGEERLSLSHWNPSRPLQINLCFNEPLLEPRGEAPVLQRETRPAVRTQAESYRVSLNDLEQFFKTSRHPIAIVSTLSSRDREAVVQFLCERKIPVYLEGVSGLREDPRLQSFQIRISDRILERATESGYPVDGVIRIGGIPTLRLWRDLELQWSSLPVLSLSHLPFTGLGRPSFLIQSSFEDILARIPKSRAPELTENVLHADFLTYKKLQDLLQQESKSEISLLAQLSEQIPSDSVVYVGNSLPIREWDLAASRNQVHSEVWANRGVNGIDGQISSFLGLAEAGKENWAILGDLTTLYDLAGPWILNQLTGVHVNFLVINNSGGKIFSRLFPGREEFLNRHSVQFKGLADLWGLNYEKWTEIPRELNPVSNSRIIELIPDEESSLRFWKSYAELK